MESVAALSGGDHQQLLDHESLPGGPQTGVLQQGVLAGNLQQLIQQTAIAEVALRCLHLAFEGVDLPRLQQLPACSEQIRSKVAGTSLEVELDDVIAAILLTRFSGRTVPEICAMGGITVDDFTSSVAYREIFGLGHQQGEQKGRQAGLQEGQEQGRQVEAIALTLRLLEHRCGALTPSQQARIQALSLTALETLSVALLDFQGTDDLNAWLSRHAG